MPEPVHGDAQRLRQQREALVPTGRELRCRMTAFFLFNGADLVCERVYFDDATILRQLTG